MQVIIFYIKLGLSLIGLLIALLSGLIALEFLSAVEAILVASLFGRISLLTEQYAYKNWINKNGRLE